jgi:hypothetical protein
MLAAALSRATVGFYRFANYKKVSYNTHTKTALYASVTH